jgi:hypothetical protein
MMPVVCLILQLHCVQGIKKYYARESEEAEEAREREANARPTEASFYKNELLDFAVAQRLFKEEIDSYDKAEQKKKGVQNEIKYRTKHAHQWVDNMSASQRKEVKDAKEKWNKEGAPEKSQAV